MEEGAAGAAAAAGTVEVTEEAASSLACVAKETFFLGSFGTEGLVGESASPWEEGSPFLSRCSRSSCSRWRTSCSLRGSIARKSGKKENKERRSEGAQV